MTSLWSSDLCCDPALVAFLLLLVPQSTSTENVHGAVGPAHGQALRRSTSGFIATIWGGITPFACNLQNAACWTKLSSSVLLPQPSSVPPLPLCELFLPAKIRSGSGVDGWRPHGLSRMQHTARAPMCLCSPRPPQAPQPRRDTHGHAGLALLLPLAANPLLLCPLCSTLLLQEERTLAWTPQSATSLSLGTQP